MQACVAGFAWQRPGMSTPRAQPALTLPYRPRVQAAVAMWNA
jgi:hypothetical protein